jgi:hypothetical protein
MIEIVTHRTRGHPELAQARLASAGIPSVIANDTGGAQHPFVSSGGSRLSVNEADAEHARELLSGRPTNMEERSH